MLTKVSSPTGGQSIPLFDYYLAPYVALSYVKHLAHVIKNKLDLDKETYKELRHMLLDYQKKHKLVMNEACYKELKEMIREFFDNHSIKYKVKDIKKSLDNAYDDTYDETFQAMEAFIHNLNTMHSRAGRSTAMVNVPVTWETLCPAV